MRFSVLLFDDDELYLQLLKDEVKELNDNHNKYYIDVFSTSSPLEVLDLAGDHPIDVFVLDLCGAGEVVGRYMNEDCQGLRVYKNIIAQNPLTKQNAKFIVLTNIRREIARRIFDYQNIDYLYKQETNVKNVQDFIKSHFDTKWQQNQRNVIVKKDMPKKAEVSVAGDERFKFKIGVTFTGTHRSMVNSVVEALIALGFSRDDIFYDEWHDVLINGVNADLELNRVYSECCACIVIFLAKDYSIRPWTRGVEWRAIRKLINTNKDNTICLLNVDNVDINEMDGLSSYTDIAKRIDAMSSKAVAEFIKKRYELIVSRPSGDKL